VILNLSLEEARREDSILPALRRAWCSAVYPWILITKIETFILYLNLKLKIHSLNRRVIPICPTRILGLSRKMLLWGDVNLLCVKVISHLRRRQSHCQSENVVLPSGALLVGLPRSNSQECSESQNSSNWGLVNDQRFSSIIQYVAHDLLDTGTPQQENGFRSERLHSEGDCGQYADLLGALTRRHRNAAVSFLTELILHHPSRNTRRSPRNFKFSSEPSS
jgi:hypothetical protein